MRHIIAAMVVVVAFATTGAAQTATVNQNSTEAIVLEDAPIHLLPDASRTPLRTAKEGTVLRVLEITGDWVRVEFQDPQFGLRAGYIQARFVRMTEPRYLQPMDLSVPPSKPEPVSSQTQPPAGSIERQAADAAVRDQAQQDTRMRIPPGFLWTGVGLLIGGAATIVTGVVSAEETCYDYYYYDYDCDSFKASWIGTGVAIAAAGAIVLVVGNHNREPVSMAIGPNSFRMRIKF